MQENESLKKDLIDFRDKNEHLGHLTIKLDKEKDITQESLDNKIEQMHDINQLLQRRETELSEQQAKQNEALVTNET